MNTLAKSRIHPLMAGAAVAVIVASAAATAAVMGWIPGSSAEKAEPTASASADAPASANSAAPANAAASAPVPSAPARSAPATASKQHPTRVASAAPAHTAAASCASCGTIVSVKEVEVKGEGSGGGALAGGAAGALLGHELTRGNNNSNVVAVVGGVAGALVGNEVEKRAKTKKRYDVAVRMDDGSTRTVSYEQAPSWHSGDHVRIADGKIQAR